MNYLFVCVLTMLTFFNSCKNTKTTKIESDKNKQVHEVFAPVYIDSILVKRFINFQQSNYVFLRNLNVFYEKRNYECAWITTLGINEYATNFINLLNQEEDWKKNDRLDFTDRLTELYKQILNENYKFNSQDSLVKEFELVLTLNFFEYAKRNWKGRNDEDLIKVGWLMQRKTINYEDLLDTLLTKNAHTISSFEPVYRQYRLLKTYLKKYRAIETSGEWLILPFQLGDSRKGDSSEIIVSFKKQLFLLGDLNIKDTTALFDANMEEAVKKFQNRNGLPEEGIISGETFFALNTPIHLLIEKLLINMERCRWVPVNQKGDYLVVNIPAFKLYVFNNDSLEWSCKVIVGKSKLTNNTVIFNDSMQYIVFSPYWNVPQSIIFKETIPALKKNTNYLENHHMEVVSLKGELIPSSSINWEQYHTHFPYIIRQKPGNDNALGLVKFLFPNTYNIYMHDTPTKSLFEESSRVFSHGCIRLEEAARLAEYLLREDSLWNEKTINDAMNNGKQTFVKLKTKVPVFISYSTAWVNSDGKLNLREDVYLHDEKMKRLLFAN
jgi:L,D-transpeptidase YcbB